MIVSFSESSGCVIRSSIVSLVFPNELIDLERRRRRRFIVFDKSHKIIVEDYSIDRKMKQ